MFTPFQWTVIVLLGLIALLIFSKSSLSKYSGKDTIFDLNELSWIPLEIRTLMKNRINDDVIPSLTILSQKTWAEVPSSQKTVILKATDDYFTALKKEIDQANLTVGVPAPAPL